MSASKRRIFVRFLHVECSLSLQFNLFRTQENEHPTDSSKELEGFIGSGGSLVFGRALAWSVFCGMTASDGRYDPCSSLLFVFFLPRFAARLCSRGELRFWLQSRRT